GAVVRDSSNYDRFAWASAEVGGGFSLAKGIVLGLFRDLGANLGMVEFLPTEKGHGPWIAGRGSLVKYSDHVVGEFGEVSPEVSYSFGIKSPINAGEFDVVALGSLISDPVT
ncbi:MAG: hypothetical protein CMA87_05340, partial [Euryarchaeota archaeon]|nr:hypothetical protein [Euryarchaeota archaeon]